MTCDMSPFSYITVLMSKFVRHVMLHVMLGRWRAGPVKPCSGGFVGSSVAVRRPGAATRGGFASAVRGQALAQTHSTRLRLGSGRRQFHWHFRTPSLLDAQRSNSFQGVEFSRGHPIATKLESPSVSLSCALLTMPGTFYEYCATSPQT